MNIALIGYGKMGKEIEQIALQRGHTIAYKIDLDNKELLATDAFKNVDAAIEFTAPHSAVENIKACFTAGVPVVVGSTGWYNQLPEVKKMCEEANAALFYASNFSLGVNIFFEINKKLAALMSGAEGYSVEVTEIHHTHKLDAPSGTAITIAEGILANLPAKKQWINTVGEAEANATEADLLIKSLRIDPAPGTHTVEYRSGVDRIEITHEAFSRKGFATGAVLAAEFIAGKKGVYTMSDLLKL